jgi:hypothetical protein
MRVIAVIVASGVVVFAAACGSAPASPPAQQTGAAAFSACMRAHDVLAYPDPGSNGLLPKKTPEQLGVSSAVLQSAQKACAHLVPNGGQPSQAQVAQYRSAMLIYAKCIRTHGVPNMPDPDSRGHLDIGPGTGVDVNSPKFQAAYQACKSKLAP